MILNIRTGFLITLILFFSLFVSGTNAATINAASASYGDVSAAVFISP